MPNMDMNQALFSKLGIDPETLRLLELYYGGQNRMPMPMPMKLKQPKAPKQPKPVTRYRGAVTITPEQVIAAGGRPVEAGDIASYFNEAMMRGAGQEALAGVPPELRAGLLQQISPQKKAKGQKLARPTGLTLDALASQMSTKDEERIKKLGKEGKGQKPIDHNAAALLIQDFFNGNLGVIPPQLMPPALAQYIAASGRGPAMEQALNPPKRYAPGEGERYYEQTKTPTGGRYELKERAKGSGTEQYGSTYWDQRRMTPEEMKKYAVREYKVPTTQAGMSIGLDEADKWQGKPLLMQPIENLLAALKEALMPTAGSTNETPWLMRPIDQNLRDLGILGSGREESLPTKQRYFRPGKSPFDVRSFFTGEHPSQPVPKSLSERMIPTIPSEPNVGPPYDVKGYLRGQGGPGMPDTGGGPREIPLLQQIMDLFNQQSPGPPFDIRSYWTNGY